MRSLKYLTLLVISQIVLLNKSVNGFIKIKYDAMFFEDVKFEGN